MRHSTQEALEFTDTHRADTDQLTIPDALDQPRYRATRVRQTRAQLLWAVLDDQEHTVADYGTKSQMVTLAANLNAAAR